MNDLLSWKNTSLKIDSNINENSLLIDALKNREIPLRKDGSEYTLENQESYYILEDNFINQSKNLSTIIMKYSQKNYDKLSQVYISNIGGFRDLEITSKDKNVYDKIIKENRIDADIRNFPISLNVLNEALDNKNHKSILFIDILILFALATVSNYNAEEVEAEFRIEDKNYKVKLNIIDSKPLHLYPIYDWIFNEEEYEESYNVKLQVVRQVIINKNDIKDVKGVLEDSKLAYKRIVSQKTNEYFEQLNQLKDDFLILSKNENTSLRTLNLTFFAWLGYLGLELFNIIVNYKGEDIIPYLLFSDGAKKGIVLLMFIVALIFIFNAYRLEIKSLGETYKVIKEIYEDKILFKTELEGSSKFEAIIKKPEIGKPQMLVFFIFLLVLIIRFFLTFPW